MLRADDYATLCRPRRQGEGLTGGKKRLYQEVLSVQAEGGEIFKRHGNDTAYNFVSDITSKST